MNQHYDNHANDIEFFDIHVQKKKSNKKEFVDLSLVSNDEIFDLHTETKIKLEDITELYNKTKSATVLEKLNRISRFMTAIRIAMKKRKILNYHEYEAKLKEVGLDSSDSRKYKKLYEDQLNNNIAIKEAERTKRCQLNVNREIDIHKEFKFLVKEQIGEDAYLQLIKRASNFVDGV